MLDLASALFLDILIAARFAWRRYKPELVVPPLGGFTVEEIAVREKPFANSES